MMNASSDEWTVVTAASKKRVMRKKGTRKRCPTTTSSRPSSRSPLTTEELLRGLSECQDFILSQTSLWCEVDEKIRRILPLDTRPVKEIVCLGLGNFSLTGASYYEAPLFQLALARCLQQYFAPSHGSYPPLIVHDPCFLSTEVAFLHDHVGAKSPPCSATGAYTATGDTIFFLPHCPRGLHENLVRANWKSPHVLVVISNSLTDLADRMLPAVVVLWDNSLVVRHHAQTARIYSKSFLYYHCPHRRWKRLPETCSERSMILRCTESVLRIASWRMHPPPHGQSCVHRRRLLLTLNWYTKNE